ncbi:MAG TPA: response regulator transcription factor [Polyangia bacterium]|jgi:DNA-binding response OmpR family regulator|nr:response regulator transcription factor [Polyangia bacterium]
MRLLLVEDDEKIGGFVKKGLEQEGHVLDWVRTGDDGLAHLTTTEYDAAVVDVMLPGISGLEVVRAARQKRVVTPIVILSARDAVADRVAGLEAGADDYLTKPFSLVELAARINAQVRRATTHGAGPAKLSYADLTLDLQTRRVERDGVPIELQAKELKLLEYLLRHPERVLSKAMILQHVWDYSFDPQTNVVDVLVCRLRNKIDRNYPTTLIQTLRGVGYVLRQK